MARHLVIAAAIILSVLASVCAPRMSRADLPASQPTTQTGEMVLTFTERSPLSDPKELARRLRLKATDVASDYDLSRSSFRAYIPRNYDPGTPQGLFVYLGYKDTVATPPLWQPILDKNHVIFISPISHTGENYAPSIPLWQTVGLALDAVYNCEKQFNIDKHRVYLMSWANDSLRTSFSTADVFTGFVVTEDLQYSSRINLPSGRYYPSSFTPPPVDLMSQAKNRAFFLIDDGDLDHVTLTKLIVGAMRRDEFSRMAITPLSLTEDLHFPNFKAEWFDQQALPFLDKATAAAEIEAEKKSEQSSPSTEPAAPAPNAAEHLLSMAQLYISNGQTDMARRKLQQIIDSYPSDPAADKAWQLLQKIGSQ